ncbi:MAG: glycosyltransferase family 87 protein, partial [Terracidiphilus sp.]
MSKIGEPRTVPKSLRGIAGFLLATVCGLGFGFVAMGFLLSMLSPQVVSSRDFVPFWATGQQLAHHGNPYDANDLLRIERGAGLHATGSPMFMRNPPWALPLVYPLGFLGLQVASILWSLLLLMCLVVSVRMIWIMHGRPKTQRTLLGYSFGPALLCLLNGQTSLFALLGLVLFLQLHRSRPFLAGISLWLCALKPHLFVSFGVVLIAWIVVSRSYKVLAGATLSIAASSAIAFLMDPAAWAQYSRMVKTSGMERDHIPCVSYLLRHWISPQTMWLQYLPVVLGCAWALCYFWNRRHRWDWMKDGGLVMLVSVLSAPYYWLY